MFKVIVRIETIKLRVKNGAAVQIMIRQDEEYFISNHKAFLKQGHAYSNNSIEFYVANKFPFLSICVLLNIEGIDKLAGLCNITLTDWDQNVGHNTTSNLIKSPDQRALISFFFIYFKTDQIFHGRKLLSLNAIDYQNQKIIFQEFKVKNNQLINENTRLNQEVIHLRQQNTKLSEGNLQLSENMLEQKEKYLEQIKSKNQEIFQSKIEIQDQKKKINSMIQMIKIYKDQHEKKDFKQKLKNIQKNEQNKKDQQNKQFLKQFDDLTKMSQI